MANEIFKELKTKISLKCNTYDYWTTGEGKDYAPLKGEVCFCEITPVGDPGTNNNAAQTAPTVLFKVGVDGVKKFSELKWASALAADVYSWAKEGSLFTTVNSTTVTNDDKTYTGNAVTDVEWDASLNDGKGGVKFTKGTAFATKAEFDEAIAGLTGGIGSIVDNDHQYTFEIPTTGDDKGKLVVKVANFVNGKISGNYEKLVAVDFVTPDELTEILKGYVTSATISVDTDYIHLTVTKDGKTDTSSQITLGGGLIGTEDGVLKIDDATSNTIANSVQKDSEHITNVAQGEGVKVTPTQADEDNENAWTYTVSHQDKPTEGTEVVPTTGSGRTYVTKVTTDKFGHIAGIETATEVDQVIDWENEVPAHETKLEIVDKTVTDDADTIYAINNLVEGDPNGHKVTPSYAAVPTKAYVDKRVAGAVAGAVDYLGTVGDATNLTDLEATATHGDFARVSVSFGDYHAGDLLIANVTEEETDMGVQKNVTWEVIHGEEGDITEIVAGDGLTGGGSVDSVTITHDVAGAAVAETLTDPQEPEHGETFNIPVIHYDKFGHIASVDTTTVKLPEDEDTKYDLEISQYSNSASVKFSENNTKKYEYIVSGEYSNSEGDANKLTVGTEVHDGVIPRMVISHKSVTDTTGTASAVKTGGTGRTYVTEVLQDSTGHIVGVKTATETDQDISGKKDKQTPVASQNLTGAKVFDGIAQNENGEITVSTRDLTPADIGAATAEQGQTADANKLAIDAINNAETGILAQAKADAGSKIAVALSESQKYTDEKVADLAGEGNTTTVAAVAERVKSLEDAEHISEVVAKDYDAEGNEKVSGLKVQNKNEIAIDDTIVFILNCNW